MSHFEIWGLRLPSELSQNPSQPLTVILVYLFFHLSHVLGSYVRFAVRNVLALRFVAKHRLPLCTSVFLSSREDKCYLEWLS